MPHVFLWGGEFIILLCLLIFYTTATNHILIRLWCAMKSGFYMTSNDDQLSGWTKKFQSMSQSQPCTTKMIMVTGGLLPVWSTTALKILVMPLHIRSMLIKSMRSTETATPAVSIGQQNGLSPSPRHCPTTHLTINASKVEQTGIWSFASSVMFTWPLANHLLFLQAFQWLFAGNMLPQPAGIRKCFTRVHWIPQHGFVCYRSI